MADSAEDALMIEQYRSALALAARARRDLDGCKTLNSPRAAAALKVWDTATQNAVRLSRSIRLAGAVPKSLDEELEALTGA